MLPSNYPPFSYQPVSYQPFAVAPQTFDATPICRCITQDCTNCLSKLADHATDQLNQLMSYVNTVASSGLPLDVGLFSVLKESGITSIRQMCREMALRASTLVCSQLNRLPSHPVNGFLPLQNQNPLNQLGSHSLPPTGGLRSLAFWLPSNQCQTFSVVSSFSCSSSVSSFVGPGGGLSGASASSSASNRTGPLPDPTGNSVSLSSISSSSSSFSGQSVPVGASTSSSSSSSSSRFSDSAASVFASSSESSTPSLPNGFPSLSSSSASASIPGSSSARSSSLSGSCPVGSGRSAFRRPVIIRSPASSLPDQNSSRKRKPDKGLEEGVKHKKAKLAED